MTRHPSRPAPAAPAPAAASRLAVRASAGAGAVLLLGLAFAVGRASAPRPETAHETPSAPAAAAGGPPALAGAGAGPDGERAAPLAAGAPSAAAAGAPSAAAAAQAPPPAAIERGADRPAAAAAGRAAAAVHDVACQPQLQVLRQQLASVEQQRRELEGTPVPPQSGQPERYSQAALTGAVTLAFQQSRVPGRVETVDCAEFPCIVYGRIFGDEDHVERLERAKALVPYRGDVMTMLLWTATDEALARRPGEERPERLLFAFAFYSREQKLRIGDNLDRRIRARTAELWNALRPDDEE
ncbi:MAG: hypothetical protein U1A78_10170 [Polyangia bacterium]